MSYVTVSGVRASGYLCVRIGDLVEVLHIESESDVDAGWLYVQMVNDGQCGILQVPSRREAQESSRREAQGACQID